MNRQLKQLLIVLTVCIVLSISAILLCLIDPTFVPDLYRITSMVIVTLWAFFIVPSLMFLVKVEKERLQNQTTDQAFKEGAGIGFYLGFGGLIVLCLIVSPVTGTIWFTQTISRIISSAKMRKIKKRQQDEPDVFDI